MKGRWTGLALAVAVGTAPAFADNARPRGGSSGGGHSVGRSHHSGGGGGHRSGGGSSHAGSAHSGSSASHARPRNGAEARHPRAGTGTGPRYYRGRGYPYYGHGYSYRYRPYSYGYWPYWAPSYWYSPYYGGYGYGYGPAYRYGYRDESGAVRTFVEPSETRIHVDGSYAGTADDFDGLLQRLYVSPGAHELMLSLEGYKTHRVKIYVSPGGTLKLHYDMVKGAGEDAQIDTLGDPEDERFGRRGRRDDAEDDEDDGADRDEVRRDDRPAREADARGRGDDERPRAGLTWGNELGTVRLAIQPGDASVYVDGRFRGPANGLRSLRLSPGRHHIEVVRPGFRTEERDVDIRDGEDTTLELELSRS